MRSVPREPPRTARVRAHAFLVILVLSHVAWASFRSRDNRIFFCEDDDEIPCFMGEDIRRGTGALRFVHPKLAELCVEIANGLDLYILQNLSPGSGRG